MPHGRLPLLLDCVVVWPPTPLVVLVEPDEVAPPPWPVVAVVSSPPKSVTDVAQPTAIALAMTPSTRSRAMSRAR